MTPDIVRESLEKIVGVREYARDDHAAAARHKPAEGLWTTDEYLADIALDALNRSAT